MSTAETAVEWSEHREQLRTFHITARGLDEWVPALTPAAVLAGRELSIADRQESPALVHAGALLASRGPARGHFLSKLRQSTDRLSELLDLDDSHSPDAVNAAALSSALGPGAERFLSTASIANALRKRVNPSNRMEPARRERCRQTAATLRNALDTAAEQAALYVFSTSQIEFHASGAELRVTSDPCGDAFIFCRQQLFTLEATLRALRVARLEIESAYDAPHHEPILSRFRWSAAHPEEIAGMPPILVIMTAVELGTTPVARLARLLRSGFPVQILVLRPGLSEVDFSGEEPDFAALALAHRDAFVVQSSQADPETLHAQLTEMAHSIHPAIAVVATGEPAATSLLAQTYAWPLFTFEPHASGTLRSGLRFEKQVDANWTPAHAAALWPSLRQHFRLLPEEAEDGDQVELSHYLERYQDRAPLAIPYLAIQGEDGRTRRLAVSRDLAEFCHDRMQAWRWLQDAVTEPAVPVPVEVKAADPGEAMQQGAAQAVARVIALFLKQEG